MKAKTILEALESDVKTLKNVKDLKNVDMTIHYYTTPINKACNATITVEGKKARLRASVIIIKDGKILLAEDSSERGVFSLPGGGLNPGESGIDAARREAEEEVGIDVKNMRPTGCDYCEMHTRVKDWVRDNVPEEEWWYHYYTQLFIADYDKKFTGDVAEEDKDDLMIKTMKFYDIDDVVNKPDFKPQWKEALIKFGYYEENTDVNVK